MCILLVELFHASIAAELNKPCVALALWKFMWRLPTYLAIYFLLHFKSTIAVYCYKQNAEARKENVANWNNIKWHIFIKTVEMPIKVVGVYVE